MSILGVTLMRMLRTVVLGALLVSGSVHARPDQGDDWDIFGRVLSLVQSIVHSAAQPAATSTRGTMTIESRTPPHSD